MLTDWIIGPFNWIMNELFKMTPQWLEFHPVHLVITLDGKLIQFMFSVPSWIHKKWKAFAKVCCHFLFSAIEEGKGFEESFHPVAAGGSLWHQNPFQPHKIPFSGSPNKPTANLFTFCTKEAVASPLTTCSNHHLHLWVLKHIFLPFDIIVSIALKVVIVGGVLPCRQTTKLSWDD